MKLKTSLLFLATLFVLSGVLLASTTMVETAYAADCVIPSSGPWPPCARNGNARPNAPSQNGNGCVIPPTGPWPPCASNEGNTSNNQGNDCVIPSTGPWPPCASSGSGNQGNSSNNDCVIPTSGPWPPCANSGNDSGNTNTTANTNTNPTPTPTPNNGNNNGGGQGWPPPPAAGATVITGARNVVHQGRGAKQSSIAVSGLGNTITSMEVVVDFTFSGSTCAAGGSIERGVLGYALVSPSGTRVDLINVAQLSGKQNGQRAQIVFTDGAPSPIHILSGKFAPADPLNWFADENPNGTWNVIAFKNDWAGTVCQHSVALHIVTQ
ncbi:MAG: hypothetical protein ACPG8W_10590 [Candidatus Promineifilaceae bacterium]